MLWLAVAALIFEVLGFIVVRHINLVREVSQVETQVEHIKQDCCPEEYGND